MSRVIFLIILGMLITQPSWSKESMKKCSNVCKEDISIKQCINEELDFWETEDKRQLLKHCKELIRQEYRDCMDECKQIIKE